MKQLWRRLTARWRKHEWKYNGVEPMTNSAAWKCKLCGNYALTAEGWAFLPERGCKGEKE